MVLAIVLIVLAILLGLGGLVFTALKWLLIVAVVMFVAGVVAGVLTRGRPRPCAETRTRATAREQHARCVRARRLTRVVDGGNGKTWLPPSTCWRTLFRRNW